MSELEAGPETLERATLACFEHSLQLTALDLAAANAVVNAGSRTVGQFFTEWDVLITPTTNDPPLPLGTLNQDADLDAQARTRCIFDFFARMSPRQPTGRPA